MTTRTRFAPSPTGYLHIGGARTALFSWLYARRHGGEFILRIEDTDRERSTQESVDAILQGMDWLGLDYDQGPYYQSERFDRYREIIQRLLDEDKAYHCYCSREELEAMRAEQLARKEKPRYNGRCRDFKDAPPAGMQPVVRFRNPLKGEVVVEDLVRGRVVFDNAELDDLIIARADGTPTYNLTVVVDDRDMAITHVVRGDDHLNNTPRQINILKALGVEPPQYAHVPMILGPDGKRLSKRHGAVSVMQYREEGYLAEALLNYLVRLGWARGDQEIFSRKQMIELFDIKDINHSAASFDPDKLLWLNQHYIKKNDPATLAGLLRWQMARLDINTENGPDPAAVVEAQRERARTLAEMAGNSRFFYEDFENYDEKAASKNLTPQSGEILARLMSAFEKLAPWRAQSIHDAILREAEACDLKLGKAAQPLRVAISGGAVSPPIDITLELLGRRRTQARIQRAVDYIRASQP